MNKSTLTCALGLMLLGLPALPSCQGIGSRTGSSVPPSAATAQSATPSGTTSGLTKEQGEAGNVRQGMKDHNPLSVAFAQKMVLMSALQVGYNAAYQDTRPKRPTLGQLLDHMMVWPLTSDGKAWPITTLGDTASYPRVTGSKDGTLMGFALVVQAYPWDAAPADPLQTQEQSEWATSLGDKLGVGDPPDSSMDAVASRVLQVLAFYEWEFGTYPSSPEEAFTAQHVALVQEVESQLKAAYPTLTFYKRKDGNGIGLLMEGPGHTRWLLVHRAASGSLTVSPIGHPSFDEPGARTKVDQELDHMELWDTFDHALATVPRVHLADISKDSVVAQANGSPLKATTSNPGSNATSTAH